MNSYTCFMLLGYAMGFSPAITSVHEGGHLDNGSHKTSCHLYINAAG
jgi:hypothetical protein